VQSIWLISPDLSAQKWAHGCKSPEYSMRRSASRGLPFYCSSGTPVLLIGFLVLLLLGVSVSYLRMQRSLRWWQARQSEYQSAQADLIRDGVLQDSFALRRSLEFALTHPGDDLVPNPLTGLAQKWLGQVEAIQSTLETVSNHLAPPYCTDNLPLAVRFLLEQWQQQHPNVTVTVTSIGGWCQQPGDSNRIVLMALHELLQLTQPEGVDPVALQANLQQHNQVQELIIHLSTPDLSKVKTLWDQQALTSLQQSFGCLTSGRLIADHQPLTDSTAHPTASWRFRWHPAPVYFHSHSTFRGSLHEPSRTPTHPTNHPSGG
jgi:hypothetical protein